MRLSRPAPPRPALQAQLRAAQSIEEVKSHVLRMKVGGHPWARSPCSQHGSLHRLAGAGSGDLGRRVSSCACGSVQEQVVAVPLATLGTMR